MRDNYDFSQAKKNPFAGQFNGKFTAIVEHDEYNEVREYDFTKTPREMKIVEVIHTKPKVEKSATAV